MLPRPSCALWSVVSGDKVSGGLGCRWVAIADRIVVAMLREAPARPPHRQRRHRVRAACFFIARAVVFMYAFGFANTAQHTRGLGVQCTRLPSTTLRAFTSTQSTLSRAMLTEDHNMPTCRACCKCIRLRHRDRRGAPPTFFARRHRTRCAAPGKHTATATRRSRPRRAPPASVSSASSSRGTRYQTSRGGP